MRIMGHVEDPNSLRQRYKMATLALGYKSVEIANKTGVSEAFLSQIIKRGAPAKRLSDIADVLGVHVEWLRTGAGPAPAWYQPSIEISSAPPTPIENRPNFADSNRAGDPKRQSDIAIPMLTRASISMGMSVSDHPTDVLIHHNWRSVVIYGDSGMPMVWPGQTVLVDPDAELRKDRIVVFEDDSGPVIKRFVGISENLMILAGINAGLGSQVIRVADIPYRPMVVVGVIWTDGSAT